MLEITNTEVYGIKGAIRGMRNPYDSWEKSDSTESTIGLTDLELCKKLIKGGTEHRKFLRMIHVQADIKGPLYFWKQMDTYKVGTVANSCSTMHTIAKREFTLDDFSTDGGYSYTMGIFINHLNEIRESYLNTHSKREWRALIQLLPEGYNQKRTIDMNYETLMTIYKQRKNHKLTEWHELAEWIETLPYMEEFLK